MSEEIKQEIIEQYKEFLNKLYGTEGTVTYEQAVRDFATKLDEFMSTNEHNDVDFDLQVNVRYRLGEMKKGKGVTKYLKGKTLATALDSEFNVDEDATAIEVSIKPVYLSKDNTKFTSRNKNTFLYKNKIIIGNINENIATDKARKKYGVKENDMLLPLKQIKKSKLLKFKPVTYEIEK